ncbi:LysR family transcriptional regulator [Streptomyces sp. FXJ1.4098]|nr:LysR family transcriptional regulator [Streptomyces sp. FXJ1.4098]
MRFADGSEAHGDIVIGADGINSAIRRQITGPEPVREAGYVCWLAIVPFSHPNFETGSVLHYWGSGQRFGLLDVGHGQTYWFGTKNMSVERAADWQGTKEEIVQAYAGWADEVQAAIRVTPEKDIIAIPARDRDFLEQWGDGRVTLLGDAAHPMLTSLAQGAGMAIEDAVVLAGTLARAGDLTAGLRSYEDQRRERNRAMVLGSRALSEQEQLEDPGSGTNGTSNCARRPTRPSWSSSGTSSRSPGSTSDSATVVTGHSAHRCGPVVLGRTVTGMDFSLQQLRGFVAVAEEQHFGRAAARLNMTQPPLTRQIQALERSLGVVLFERTGRGTRLTAAGQALLDHCRRVLALLDAAPVAARHAAEGRTGTLRLAFTAIGAYAILADVLDLVNRHLPDVSVELTELVSPDQFAALADLEIDMGLVRPPIPDQYQSVLVHSEDLVLAVPADHALARAEDPVALADVADDYIGYTPRAPGICTTSAPP